jgi:spore germination cell wall hydrolase CwlJ-like protein
MSDPCSEAADLEQLAGPSSGSTEPPDPDDVDVLARMIFGEGADHYDVPGAMEGIGWVARNRIGARGFPDTLTGVINQTDTRGIPQFSAVGNAIWNGNKPWTQAGNPSTLQGSDIAAYKRAHDVAQGILSGQIADPTGGATYYYTSNDGQPPGGPDGFFSKAMNSGRLVQSADRVGRFTFLKDTQSR